MELELKNVGIIEDSQIKIDGLTVITGKNNSGKSTVGKVLFSIIDSVEQIEIKALNDRIAYTKSTIYYALDELELRYFKNIRFQFHEKGDEKSESLLEQIAFGNFIPLETTADAIKFVNLIIGEINGESLINIINKNQLKSDKLPLNKSITEKGKNIEIKRERAISILNELIAVLNSDRELIEYSNTSIQRTLNSEFNSQIHPVNAKRQREIVIRLKANEETYFDIRMKENNIIEGSHSFILSPFQNSFLIDDAFAIDEVKPIENSYQYIADMNFYRYSITRGDFENDHNYNKLLNSREILSHKQKLIKILSTNINKSIIEENAIKVKINAIMMIINSVLPGNFKLVDNKYVYNCNNANLNIQNLATGSKMFAILKLLIEKNLVNSKTMLILDEPEIHLHPEWQNIFAEILVLLVKEIELKILLTTHSPNFLLAIDVFTKKHQINQNTNYYLTKINDKDSFCMIDVSKNLEEAYSHLVAPYLDLDVLRHKQQNDE